MLLHNKFKVESLGNSIMRVTVCDDIELEIQDAKDMRNMLVNLSSNEKYCVLLDATNPFTVSPEARALIAGKEFSSERIAAAFVITSLANMLIGNFFIKVNKPSSPTKIFSTEENAFQWLKAEVVKHNERIIV